MKTIIIFGATGNLGVYLTDYLFEHLDKNEFSLIAVGRRKTNFFEKYKIKYIPMDICDKSAFDQLPKQDVYAAIHLAGVLPAGMTDDDPYTYFNSNLYATINILEYLRKTKTDRIIYTQSYADIAGHWDKQIELMPSLSRSLKFTGDHALYSISKCAAVDVMQYYYQTFGLKNFILRLPNIYMYSPNEYYYVNGVKKLISYRYIIKKAIKSEPIELWGDPNRVRDMVYIKDFCQLVMRCVIANNNGGVYNVGTGVGTSMEDQIKGIIEVFSPEKQKSPILYCPDKPNAMQYIMNIDNAKNELGYNPQYMYLDYLRDYKIEMNLNRFKEL